SIVLGHFFVYTYCWIQRFEGPNTKRKKKYDKISKEQKANKTSWVKEEHQMLFELWEKENNYKKCKIKSLEEHESEQVQSKMFKLETSRLLTWQMPRAKD